MRLRGNICKGKPREEETKDDEANRIYCDAFHMSSGNILGEEFLNVFKI